jgi:hypothetical protein
MSKLKKTISLPISQPEETATGGRDMRPVVKQQ